MWRHEFKPGRLVVGLTALGAAVPYLGDAAGVWQAPWYLALAVVGGGLCLGALVAWVNYRIRRRRPASTASRENTGAPASTSGSQAMR
ncbi:hypothetical protein DVH02_12935 [Streptomyces corynorhini]|uniref:Uncharacterized protein n=1 Tax=Streptomyces corynorhini TaxID=2282652 RepID=A0A370BBI8_9ACTN|nr:hypothetical protein DVH02_12935 [Streptomyces corynorhini]